VEVFLGGENRPRSGAAPIVASLRMRGRRRRTVQTLVAKQRALREVDNMSMASAQQRCDGIPVVTFATKTVESGRVLAVPKVE
jgi:hypothetical protein